MEKCKTLEALINSFMVKNQKTWCTLYSPNRIKGRLFFFFIYYVPRQRLRLQKRTRLCVSLCVCLFVSTLTAEPFDKWSQNLVQGLTLIISQRSLLVRVTGQRSMSRGQRTSFSGFSDLSEQISSLGLCCDVMTSHDHMTSWDHIMTSYDITA